MNADFEDIKSILLQIRSEYLNSFVINGINANIYITERDIVSEIYCRLKSFCSNKNLSSHTEVKPAPSVTSKISELKRLPRIDNVILKNIGEREWILEAINLQNKYKKGLIEARFSSIPIEFFHSAIEVKIQSNLRDAKKDIDKLKVIQDTNKDCNCFFILFNARGRLYDHDSILKYAKKQNIFIIECTCNKKLAQFNENSHRTQKINNKIINKNVSIPRRRRIINLINQNFSDNEILKIINDEYPLGTFKSSNYAALYNIKRGLELKIII